MACGANNLLRKVDFLGIGLSHYSANDPRGIVTKLVQFAEDFSCYTKGFHNFKDEEKQETVFPVGNYHTVPSLVSFHKFIQFIPHQLKLFDRATYASFSYG